MRKTSAIASMTLIVGLAGCGDRDEVVSWRQALSAHCTVNVIGKGTKQMEDDYLPHVVACENGGADGEALKVQAVAARTYAYYKMRGGGSVKDSQGDQVYTCGRQPSAKHYAAVKATAGQILRYQGTIIAAFFVAGGKPSASNCVFKSGDPDPTNTERYVTYNEGKSGAGLTQTTLGWVAQSNKANRGCMSQNGSHCQSLKGKGYQAILKFYYGADIELLQTTGSCVTPPPVKPDSGVPEPKPDLRVSPPQPDAEPPVQFDSEPAGPRLDAGPIGDDAHPPIWGGDTGPGLQAGGALSGGCAVGGETGGGASNALWCVVALLLVSGLTRSRRRGGRRRGS